MNEKGCRGKSEGEVLNSLVITRSVAFGVASRGRRNVVVDQW